MSWGELNPWPFVWGGDLNETEEVYGSLRKIVGEGGPGPELGVEDHWRIAKAEAIAAACTTDRRAALQAFPQEATDHIHVFEDLLLVPPEGTDVDRRNAIATALTIDVSATIPDLRTAGQKISTYFDIAIANPATSINVQLGKTLNPRELGAPGYGRTATEFPNFSSHFEIQVTWNVADSGKAFPPDSTRLDLEALLNRILPGWVDYIITQKTGVFLLDGGFDGTSLLDITSLG